MESLSKQELISTITKQSDQVKRYETRLRDVVAAYKGLVKEKEALEISLKALNNTESKAENDDSVGALTLSISTLTAEKARMEEAFQADKKCTRDRYENTIAALREEMKSLVQQHQAEINNMRAKISYEIQEREKERADHSAMMKEFQLKLNSEIRSKVDERTNASSDSNGSTLELEKRVRDLSSELEAAQRRLARAEARTSETPALLVRLQEKMALLEQTHSVAIREEQIKAKRAEETARKVCARQEERVAQFEAKLAELSQTIGEYDARRRSDLQTISQLKETLNAQLLDRFATGSSGGSFDETKEKSETDNDKLADSEYLQTLIDKIHILKQELVSENQKLGSPIDVYAVLKLDGFENIHNKCQEEYEKLQSEFEAFKIQNVSSANDGDDDVRDKLYLEIAELKMRVENSKDLIESERLAKKEAVESLEAKLKTEQGYHKDIVSDLKTRIQALEKQVQTQRDRYAALLEETDNYMRARNEKARRVSTEDSHVIPDVSAPPHMLHYAHELARKDLDISQLRKDKHHIEGQLRDCQREATIEKERFKEVVRTLKEEIERLRRIQSREGANLEYLKNVVMAYLMSTDYEGRRHMLNAIAAVLHFTRSERNMVLKNL